MAALSLESSGFVKRGEALDFVKDGETTLKGSLPVSTFGGLKARGHPVGATGVYQLVEAVDQLRETAGKDNQVSVRKGVAVVQNIGGAGSSVYTHVLRRHE